MEHFSGIIGVSYIGNPVSNTAMFVTKKVAHLLDNLKDVSGCLIFAENGIKVNDYMQKCNYFCFSDKPQRDYAKFVNVLYSKRIREERQKKYMLTSEGYYVGEGAVIGENSYIEPLCIIGHDVTIGRNATILSGTVIKNSIIGDDFLANEHSLIGAAGFTITEDEHKNKLRIPTMGGVKIGNRVEIGAHDNISCGTGGNTIIEDYVKLDAFVYIGHDSHLFPNVEITAGNIVGGFAVINKNVYVGINSSIRNRIFIGENSIVGMGSNVTKSVESNITVAGNPARMFEKKKKE